MKVKQFEDFKLWVRDEKDWGFWQNDNFEPEETKLIKSLLKPNWTCLDIGANIGYFTILMAKRCRIVRSYEPESSNYQQLIKNILLNQTFNIYPSRIALTEQSGQALLYLCNTNNGMNRVYPSILCNGQMIVKTVKFDDIWNELDRFNVDFIKMDIEGSELGALRGMNDMLLNNHPTILMEFHPPSIEEYGANPREVYDFMINLGYDVRLVPQIDEPISYEELYLETNNVRGGQNLLCLPKQ